MTLIAYTSEWRRGVASYLVVFLDLHAGAVIDISTILLADIYQYTTANRTDVS